MAKKILIVGGGSREHALGAGLFRAGERELVFAPGNAGTERIGRRLPISANDVNALVDAALSEKVDLVVVGPEQPLVDGIVDVLEAKKGPPVFGPSRAAARLEGSKAFMKKVCRDNDVPTADFEIFDDAEKAKAYVRAAKRPLVVKADGLCAGKGVVVASDEAEAIEAIENMMVRRAFGDAGCVVVIEETLRGEEASFHVVCDGTRAVPLVAAQDHKRVFDGDRGPNTGGMGAYAPAPIVTPAVQEEVMRRVVEPTLKGMRALGAPFRGVLFVGLMIDEGRPKVLEFNVRFGDPETTVLVPLLDREGGDAWFHLLDGAARGDLSGSKFGTKPGFALSVVMAAEGYPGKPTVGDRIEGLDVTVAEGMQVFHAGTKREGDAIVTAGGRILTVTAHAPTLERARANAYGTVDTIRWRGEHHRQDIGHRALAR